MTCSVMPPVLAANIQSSKFLFQLTVQLLHLGQLCPDSSRLLFGLVALTLHLREDRVGAFLGTVDSLVCRTATS